MIRAISVMPSYMETNYLTNSGKDIYNPLISNVNIRQKTVGGQDSHDRQSCLDKEFLTPMAKIRLELPEKFKYSTEIEVRISDINYGNHVGNDAILSMIHEARLRYLKHHHFTELDIEGLGIIMTDTVIIYKSQAFHGDIIKAEVTAADFNKYGCDFVFRLSNVKSGKEVARAKTGIVFFNYAKQKVVPAPEKFKKIMGT